MDMAESLGQHASKSIFNEKHLQKQIAAEEWKSVKDS